MLSPPTGLRPGPAALTLVSLGGLRTSMNETYFSYAREEGCTGEGKDLARESCRSRDDARLRPVR